MVNNVEQRVYAFVRPYAGTYLFKFKQVELTPETDLDSDLSLDELEAGELMDTFFDVFKVERGNFKIETYYPDVSVSWLSLIHISEPTRPVCSSRMPSSA